MKPPSYSPRGFTLIELLVVIAIIALLAALILPASMRSIRRGRETRCTANGRQIATAIMAYEASEGRLPWWDSGVWGPVTTPNGGSVMGWIGRNWEETLRALKYLPDTPTKDVWRCPEVTQAEIDALDSNGWKANRGGYGVSANIFRTEKTTNGAMNAEVRSAAIPSPGQFWLVGDTGAPAGGSSPNDIEYLRTSVGFSRPSSKGAWRLDGSPYAPSQPALRHMKRARYTRFDGSARPMTWADMVAETDNFTARGVQ